MPHRLLRTSCALLVVLCAACRLAEPGRPAPERASHALQLARWMCGSFSSARQAALEPARYHDLCLELVLLWRDREDGPWLYVEQAAAGQRERPYRQRVYRLVDERDGGVRADVYELPGNPLTLAGAWRDREPLAELEPTALRLRDGCSLHFRRTPGGYEGETRGSGCASNQAGAAYASSRVTVSATALTSWDRGFDADGERVWGPADGPYVFLRVTGE